MLEPLDCQKVVTIFDNQEIVDQGIRYQVSTYYFFRLLDVAYVVTARNTIADDASIRALDAASLYLISNVNSPPLDGELGITIVDRLRQLPEVR